MSPKNPFSIVVISENEEANIQHCIESCVKHSDDVWLLDSNSTDDTVRIARDIGANVVIHEFESWGGQRNYALDSLVFKHNFVLFLDADEAIDDAFASELSGQIESGNCEAFRVNFNIFFLGKLLKYAHENPPILRVIKKGSGRWVSEGAREYCVVDGNVGKLKSRIHHEDRRGIFFWLVKHIRNANREANVLLGNKEEIRVCKLSKDRTFERSKRVLLRRFYNRLPRATRPFLVFVYRYFIRGGFLDGYPGLMFCLLQGSNIIIVLVLLLVKCGSSNKFSI